MHKNATKCNKTLSKWCKNKHGASKIYNTYKVDPHYSHLIFASLTCNVSTSADSFPAPVFVWRDFLLQRLMPVRYHLLTHHCKRMEKNGHALIGEAGLRPSTSLSSPTNSVHKFSIFLPRYPSPSFMLSSVLPILP
jgi:hypothetical protein